MAHWFACAPSRPMVRAVAATAAMVALSVAVAAGAVAQTLTDPNPKPKASPPPVAAKSAPAGHAKSCTIYGEGFVYVPGTDACVKVGGYVRMEGTAR